MMTDHEGGQGPYRPCPEDTGSVAVPEELALLTEKLARNTHEVWALGRFRQGWTYGPVRDDGRLQTPCMVPYEDLPEDEKEYDRRTAMETIRLILKLGYKILPPDEN